MSSNDIQSLNHDVAYKNSDLHRRVQSVIRAYRQQEEESKESFSDCRVNQPANTAERKEQTTFGCKTVSFSDGIKGHWEESKEATSDNKNTQFPHLAQCQSKIPQPDRSLNTERKDIYNRGRELYLDGTQSLEKRSESFCHESLQDRVDEDIESILSFFRDRLNKYEMAKLRRQGESNLELTTNIHRRLIQSRALSRSTDKNKTFLTAERYEQNDNTNTNDRESHHTSPEDMDKLRRKLRENLSSVRYRIHSSKALLGKHYDDPADDGQQPKQRTQTTAPIRKLNSLSNQARNSIQIPERCNLLTSMTDDFKFNKTLSQTEMMAEHKSMENGWALDPADLPSPSTSIPNTTAVPERLSQAKRLSSSMGKDENYAMINTSKQVSNSLEGIHRSPNRNPKTLTQKKKYPGIKSMTMSGMNSTAFDPFPSNLSDPWNDFMSPVSDFSSNVLVGTLKSCDVSNDDQFNGESAIASNQVESTSATKTLESEGSEANSIIETSETENRPHKITSKPKKTRRRASFLCKNNKPKPSEVGTELPSEKSVSTSDHSSTRGTSSFDIPAPPNSKESSTISKDKNNPEKKGMPRRILISSISRVNTANKEWLVKSIESEHDVQRKRDQKMREWLNGGISSGEGTVQGCVMDTVFYDTRQECLQGK